MIGLKLTLDNYILLIAPQIKIVAFVDMQGMKYDRDMYSLLFYYLL